MKDENEEFKRLLKAEVPPIKLGNKNKSGKCGMCGINVQKLYPQKVGQVDFMICERCKMIMVCKGGTMTEYQERMKEWAEQQDWKLIKTISGCETGITINCVSFAISRDEFSNFEREFIELVAKYRI